MKTWVAVAVLHLAIGAGWMAHANGVRVDVGDEPMTSMSGTTVVFEVRDMGGPPRTAPGVAGIGTGGYLTIDAPELFDPVHDVGLTVEIWIYLIATPGPKNHWVLFGKPDSYILTLHGAATDWPWSHMQGTSDGVDTTHWYTCLSSLTSPHVEGVTGGIEMSRLHPAFVGRWLPVVVMLREGDRNGRSGAGILVGGAGGTSGLGIGTTRIMRSTSALHIGGMPVQQVGGGTPARKVGIGGAEASMRGYLGSLRISLGVRDDRPTSYTRSPTFPTAGRGFLDPIPTELTADETTLALWNFEDGPGVYTDSVGGHMLRYVGSAPPPPPADLPPITDPRPGPNNGH